MRARAPRRRGQIGPFFNRGVRLDPGWAYKWGLVSHWPLNEGSGQARDLHGTNHLTAMGAPPPGNNVGHINPMCRQFTQLNSNAFSIASNATLQSGDVDFWLSAWVMLDSKVQQGAGDQSLIIVGKQPAGGTEEYQIYFNISTDRFSVIVADQIRTFATFGSPSLSTWYFLLMWYDSVNDLVKVRANDGGTDQSAAGAPTANASNFMIGGSNNGGNERYFSGRIESVSFGKSPPGGIAGRIDEISTVLYNATLGSPYPFGGSPA